MRGAWRRHRRSDLEEPNFNSAPPAERFMMGSKDNFKTFEIYEWLDDEQTQVVCTTTSEAYATFITAALNTCKEFSPCSELD